MTPRQARKNAPAPHSQQRAISYLASADCAFTTAIAEYVRDESGAGVGPIDATFDHPTVTMFGIMADLVVLLDLLSGWVTRAGGN